jgi:glycosyltransferase involved in cell wall biosynthesis
MVDTRDEHMPEELISALYRTLLLREPDPAGLRDGAQLFRDGYRFDELMLGLLRSEEFRKNYANFAERYRISELVSVSTERPVAKLASAAKLNAKAGTTSVAGVLISYDAAHFLSVTLPVLAECLDELIIVDMGSTDESRSIYEAHLGSSDKIVSYDRENLFKFGFSHPRNYGAKFATSDWILSIDTDELIVADEIRSARRILLETDLVAFNLPRRNYVYDPQYSLSDVDELMKSCSFGEEKHRRLYRNLPDVEFRGIIHEELHKGDKNLYSHAADAPIVIHHFATYGSGDGNEKDQLYAFLLLRAMAYPGFRFGTNSSWFEDYVPEHFDVLLTRANEFAERWRFSPFARAQIFTSGGPRLNFGGGIREGDPRELQT